MNPLNELTQEISIDELSIGLWSGMTWAFKYIYKKYELRVKLST